MTSTIPIKPPKFATVKSTNYLPNVLSQLEAEEAGAFTSIWLDQEGYIAEGPNMNVAFLSKNGVLMIPPFDNVLAGCTVRRVLELVPKLVDEKLLPGLVGAKIQRITVKEAKEAVEMMLIGSGVLVKPVVEWDGQPIGNGTLYLLFFFNLNPKWMAFNVESVPLHTLTGSNILLPVQHLTNVITTKLTFHP